MNACEDDSDDDIFVVRRRKPVGRLTKQKAIEIKKIVLDRENLNSSHRNDSINSVSGKSENERTSVIISEKSKMVLDDDDDDEISILEERITTRFKGNIDGTGGKKKTPIKTETTPDNSPSKLITHYFTPTKRTSSELRENMNDKETCLSSDCDLNMKKRKVLENESSQVKSSKLQTKTRKSNGEVSFDSVDSGSGIKKKARGFGTSYYYSRSLKGIIHQEISNQASLQQKTVEEGNKFGKLITENEMQYIENFFKLPNNAFELFARMLCRKKGWHRILTITYEDIQGKEEDIFRVLNLHKFVDLDVQKEDMESQLNLLSKSEVQMLCRQLSIKVTGTKKDDYIDALVRSGRCQRSVSDLWRKDSGSKREQLLRNEIVEMLGPCMKLNESFLTLLNRLLLLFSLPHNVTEEDKWSTQIHMMTEVYMGVVSYPNYEVKPTVIFNNRNDFLLYEKSMELLSRLDGAVLCKNTEEFTTIGQEAKKEFKQLVNNEGFKERVKTLPPFLRRYNAGSVYAKILTTYCEKYKKNKAPDEVIEIMEMLVNQDTFSVSKKGTWYHLLVQAYSDCGKVVEAGSTLLTALKGNNVSEVERLLLQQKGGLLLKKKKNALEKGELRNELDDVCTVDVTEPSKIEIKAWAMDKNESGFKSVYMFRDKTGTLSFASVEETVINHYKENGFSKGVHAEGFIIQTMYFLVFYDIIYNLSPPGVFQNPYQSQPLDFSSRSFYINRKEEIDARLKEMRTWSLEKYEDLIARVYTKNVGVRCVITWKDGFTPNIFCEILRCLGIQQFTSICERLVHNYRVYRSGFPDLTVWNPTLRKCKFVEVKGPSDKLSPNQRLWLDFLCKLNVDCEVCNVKNIASKQVTS